MKLDYNLKTPEERIKCVKKLLEETPKKDLRPQYLSYMADYILFVRDKKQTKIQKKTGSHLLTNNREKTINKREVSFEEVVSNLENGEDGIYALINNDKNQLLDRKEKLTEKDKEENPSIKEQLDIIDNLQKKIKEATGQQKYGLKKQIIETWQQIYLIKASERGGVANGKMPSQVKTLAHIQLNGEDWLDKNKMPQSSDPINLFNPQHVSFLLCYYPQLKQETYDDFNSDIKFLLWILEDTAERALKEKNPVLWSLLIWKIDGKTNEEIKKLMEDTYEVVHNEQYYSTLWRKKIPKLICEQAQKDFVYWYYSTQIYGDWKTCTRCGETKPAHSIFYSKNSSKDGWYSLCKACRSKK